MIYASAPATRFDRAVPPVLGRPPRAVLAVRVVPKVGVEPTRPIKGNGF